MEKKVSKIPIFVLAIITAIGLIRITYVFAFEKTGFHSDEIWGYGTANSYYEPFIYAEDEALDNSVLTPYKNFNEWLSGDVFGDYITVQEGEQFAYGSVYYNTIKDNHPPFFFLILHTICSLFPNSYSLWYGFIINIVCFIAMMIFAYKTAKLMTNSEFYALAFCGYFAICDGILNLFVFVRMYTISTAVFTAFLYFTLRLVKTEKLAKNVPWLALLVFLGAYAHHFFIIPAGILTALVSIYYLIKRKFKILFINGFSLLGGAGLSVLAFPATIAHLLKDSPNTTADSKLPPFVFSVKACFRFMCSELFGVQISPYQTQTIDYIMVVVILLLAIFVPIGFLLRKNEWVKTKVFTLPKRIWTFFKTHNKTTFCFTVLCLIMITCFVAVVSRVVTVTKMNQHTDRYLFVVYPAMALAVTYLIYELLTHLIKKHKWIPRTVFCLILVAFVVVGTMQNGCYYLFKGNEDDIVLGDTIEDANVILALSREWTLTCYTGDLMKAENVFVTSFSICELREDTIVETISKFESEKPLYLAINTDYLFENYEKVAPEDLNTSNLAYALHGHDKDQMFNIFKNLEITKKFEYVGKDHVFGATVEIYKLRD